MAHQVPHEIEYKSKRVPLETLYDAVLTQKPKLEQAGFQCRWEFLDAGKGRQLFLGQSDYEVPENNFPVRIAILKKPLSEDGFELIFSYHRRSNDVAIHGSTKVRKNKDQYDEAVAAARQFQELTGIELLIRREQ